VEGGGVELGRALDCLGWCGRERSGELGRAGPLGGERGNWAGVLVSSFFLLFFLFSFFLSYFKLKLLDFKFKLEFNPSTQTKRTMHQHECNNRILNLDKF
jgi:hypothetical protein